MDKYNGSLGLRKALLTALLGGTMAAVQLTGAIPVNAQTAATTSEAGKEEDSKNKDSKKVLDQATIERMKEDYKKIQEVYTTYDCNLPVKEIETLLEIEDYFEKNSKESISNDFTVDEVLAFRNELKDEIKEAYNELDKTNDKAVADFLAKYGKYLAEIHAHNYFTIYTLCAAINRDLAWYVIQDVENTKWNELLAKTAVDPEAYDFKHEEYKDGILERDLSILTLNYQEEDGTKRIVRVDLTAPNDDQESVGDGFADIQSVYFQLYQESLYLAEYMNGRLPEEEKDSFLGYNTFAATGTTTNNQGETEEVYSIDHNDNINDLIARGIRLEKHLSPWTTMADIIDGLDENDPDKYELTEYGFGHTFVPNENGELFSYKYDENTDTYYIQLLETFERPSLDYEDAIGKDESYVLKRKNK